MADLNITLHPMSNGSIDNNTNLYPQTIIGQVAGLPDALDGKVSVVAGKGLSTNDFTNNDKSKLDSVPTNPSSNGLYVLQYNNGALAYVTLPVYNGGIH